MFKNIVKKIKDKFNKNKKVVDVSIIFFNSLMEVGGGLTLLMLGLLSKRTNINSWLLSMFLILVGILIIKRLWKNSEILFEYLLEVMIDDKLSDKKNFLSYKFPITGSIVLLCFIQNIISKDYFNINILFFSCIAIYSFLAQKNYQRKEYIEEEIEDNKVKTNQLLIEKTINHQEQIVNTQEFFSEKINKE